MYKQHSVLQDGPLRASGRVREVIESVASSVRFNRIRVAVAYASLPGCQDLDAILRDANNAWQGAEKLWLVSIDYGHTDPRALDFLRRLRNSEVRVYDGKNLLKRRLLPTSSFHPKTFVFDRVGIRGPRSVGFVMGSANLTAGGLDGNVEYVLGLTLGASIGTHEKRLFRSVANFEDWWDLAWLSADAATPDFIGKYTTQRGKHYPRVRDRRLSGRKTRLPAPVEKMREYGRWARVKYFWIETLVLYKNRGKHAPGNQIDAKRGTRVYFGFPYRDVPRNRKLGEVTLQYGNKLAQTDRSVWFGDNSMDKIHLPIPGEYGPPTYDNSVIHFQRLRPGVFRVLRGTAHQAAVWKRKSRRQGLLGRLSGGRLFGFYG